MEGPRSHFLLVALLFLLSQPPPPAAAFSRSKLQFLGTKKMEDSSRLQLPLSNGVRMNVAHRDFSNQQLGSMVERMKSAVDRSSRRLRSFQNSIQAKLVAPGQGVDYTAPVSSGDGSYITSLTIGTPGESFSAIADTGSDLVWRQCEPCESCYTQNGPIFNPSKSSTYTRASCDDSLCQALQPSHCTSNCEYTYGYGDGSNTTGDFSYDTLTLIDSSGKTHSIAHFGFGCGHDNQGGFSDVAGLIGLGQGPLSLLSQLSSPDLSYCLVSVDDSTSQTSPMFFGTSLSLLPASNVQSTPIITNSAITTYYYIALKGISVGGQRLDIPSGTFDLQPNGEGGTIIDSGTTLTYIVNAGYNPLLAAFKSAINLTPVDGAAVGLDLCYEEAGEVPSLTLHFEGADFDLPTENYFLNMNGLFCLAMAGSSHLSIFGNIQQQNYHILYSRRSQTVSFTPARCDQL